MAEKTLVESIRDTLHSEMAKDNRIFVFGQDVGPKGGVFGVTRGLIETFGEERVIDTPLAESLIAGLAIGASLNGMLPVAEIQFVDFIHPAVDQIMNEAAKMRYRSAGVFTCPLVIRAPYGMVGGGGPYHSQSVEAMFYHQPGLKIVVPSTPYDAAGLLRSAIYDPDPVLFFEHKGCYLRIKGDVPDEPYTLPIGKADVKRRGTDVTVVTYGLMLHHVLSAADALSAEAGIEIEVVDLRTILPLDREAIVTSVKKTGKLMIVHEDSKTGGVGAEVAASVAEEVLFYLDAPIRRIAGPDVPAVPFNSVMEKAYMPTVESIQAALLELARF